MYIEKQPLSQTICRSDRIRLRKHVLQNENINYDIETSNFSNQAFLART